MATGPQLARQRGALLGALAGPCAGYVEMANRLWLTGVFARRVSRTRPVVVISSWFFRFCPPPLVPRTNVHAIAWTAVARQPALRCWCLPGGTAREREPRQRLTCGHCGTNSSVPSWRQAPFMANKVILRTYAVGKGANFGDRLLLVDRPTHVHPSSGSSGARPFMLTMQLSTCPRLRAGAIPRVEAAREGRGPSATPRKDRR